MSKVTKTQRIIAYALMVCAIIMICVGLTGVIQRKSDKAIGILDTMRIRSVLATSGEGSVEAMVEAAKEAAREEAKGGGISAIKAAVAQAEADARANSTAAIVDYDDVDIEPIRFAIKEIESAQIMYSDATLKAQDEYREMMLKQAEEEEAQEEISEDALDDISEDEIIDTARKVDMSGFKATEEMTRLKAITYEKYTLLAEALEVVYPVLDDQTLITLRDMIINQIYQVGDSFVLQYERFSPYGLDALAFWDKLYIGVAHLGDNLIVIGAGLMMLALIILFYQPLLKALGLPRIIIGAFFLLMCVLALLYDLSLSTLLSNTVVRMGMNSILVLAMLPGIQCGISLNLGLPLGIICGLLGGLMCIEYGFEGVGGFAFAIGVACAFAAVVGYLYGNLLNRLKGQEMAVTTYVGYSIVSLMCIAWMLLPFSSAKLRWPLGKGLRVTLSLATSYKHLLNDFLDFNIGSFNVPTGLLLFMALMCFLMWLFSRSRTGIAMQAVGNNQRFAEATGISVNRMRIIGTVLSTVLGAIGIIVYSQSYGFMQLYTAPRQMGFIAASAILIGGASTSRAKISNVLIGTFLFQGVLALGMPVANVLVPQSSISETMRILISNGIILYALTKSGGGSRG